MRRLMRPLVFATVALLLAEATVRLVGSRIPDPLIWGSWEAQNKVARMDAIAANGNHPDVLLVGSSVVNYSLDSTVLKSRTGLRVFNAALDGADMRTTEWWMSRVVLRRLRPRTVVLAVSSVEFNDLASSPRRLYTRLTTSPAGRALMAPPPSIAFRTERSIEHASSLFRLRSVLRSPTNIIKGFDPAQRAEAVRADGDRTQLVEQPYGLEGARLNPWRTFKQNAYVVGGSELRSLERLIRRLRSRSIGIVVIRTPVTQDMLRWHNDGAADFLKFVRAIDTVAQRYRLTLIDTGVTEDGRKSYVDPVHPNAAGRSYISNAVAPVVENESAPDTTVEDGTEAPPAPETPGEVTPPGDPSAPSVDEPPDAEVEDPRRVVIPPPKV